MDHKIMCWNIRGLGQEHKVTAIGNAIWKNDITVYSILESKKENVDDNLIRSLWGNVGCNYLYQPSVVASGGIIIMWKEGVLHMVDHLMGASSLSIIFINYADNFSWLFRDVYAASDAGDYRQYWQELSDIRILFEEPWLLGGDFNAILAQAERNLPGGNITNRRFFKKFVNQHELVDLSMDGGQITWTNSQTPPFLVRLDRFLMTADWQIKCSSILQVRLKRPVSYHTPIMLNCNSGLQFKAPFRIDNYLILHPEFLPNLKMLWQNLVFNDRPLAKKLQGLKHLIKVWKRSLGNLQTQLEQLEEMIDYWDMQEEDNIVLATSEVVAREDAKSKHAAISLNLARKWGQRAKENWAKEAEKNSRYLHQID